MKKMGLAVISAIALNLGLSGVATAETKEYVLNTASTGGTYHPVGTAIATLAKVKLLPKQGFSLNAVNSAGSGANIEALGAGTADFAIITGLFGSYAVAGTNIVSEPQENLRSVSILWQSVDQFVIPNDKVVSGTVEDLIALKGTTASMGRVGSGTIGNNKILLARLGLDVEKDFELVRAGYTETAQAMLKGEVMSASFGAGPPTGAVTKLMKESAGGFTILEITDEQAAKMDGGQNIWTPFTIPAGTYLGQSEDVKTTAQANFLVVNASVDEEHVYELTKTIYDNLPFLRAIHTATNAMAVEKSLMIPKQHVCLR